MGWLPWRRGARAGTLRTASSQDQEHLEFFARSRDGVEAFLEPRTAVTETTVVLVAGTGEWTRRRVDDERSAEALARRLGIPLYEAVRVGYPQRMRDWSRDHRSR